MRLVEPRPIVVDDRAAAPVPWQDESVRDVDRQSAGAVSPIIVAQSAAARSAIAADMFVYALLSTGW